MTQLFSLLLITFTICTCFTQLLAHRFILATQLSTPRLQRICHFFRILQTHFKSLLLTSKVVHHFLLVISVIHLDPCVFQLLFMTVNLLLLLLDLALQSVAFSLLRFIRLHDESRLAIELLF